MTNNTHVGFTKSAAASLLTFGVTIGVMTALSDAKGTVVTLFGLLFALIGGSLVSLYKGDGLTAPQREGMFHAAGWLAGGILLGLVLGFLAKVAEAKWFPTPESSLGKHAEAEDMHPASKPSGGQPILVLHETETDKIAALRNALRVQLKDQSLSAQQSATLRSLEKLIDSADFIKTVPEAAEMVHASTNLQATFADQFRSTFGQPPARPVP
jgi:hypothetical protein